MLIISSTLSDKTNRFTCIYFEKQLFKISKWNGKENQKWKLRLYFLQNVSFCKVFVLTLCCINYDFYKNFQLVNQIVYVLETMFYLSQLKYFSSWKSDSPWYQGLNDQYYKFSLKLDFFLDSEELSTHGYQGYQRPGNLPVVKILKTFQLRKKMNNQNLAALRGFSELCGDKCPALHRFQTGEPELKKIDFPFKYKGRILRCYFNVCRRFILESLWQAVVWDRLKLPTLRNFWMTPSSRFKGSKWYAGKIKLSHLFYF